MEINLFNLHSRGALVYAAQPNCSGAESNASLPATAGARRYMRPMSLHLDILRRNAFRYFPANRYFPAKTPLNSFQPNTFHDWTPQLARHAGVADVLLEGFTQAPGMLLQGRIFKPGHDVKTWEPGVLQKRPCMPLRGIFPETACSLVASKTPTYEPAPIASN